MGSHKIKPLCTLNEGKKKTSLIYIALVSTKKKSQN
jgi:hypothetical protein